MTYYNRTTEDVPKQRAQADATNRERRTFLGDIKDTVTVVLLQSRASFLHAETILLVSNAKGGRMPEFIDELRDRQVVLSFCGSFLANCALAAFAMLNIAAFAQPPSAVSQSSPSAQTISSKCAGSPAEAVKNPTLNAGAFSVQTIGGSITEDQLKQMLAGRTLYLRSGYQDNNLEFDDLGHLIGHSPRGSYTLSQIQINKVKLTKHKLELRGDRYALHFLGAAPFEDPIKATDHVKITPKKKVVRISFERVQVDKPKRKGKDKEDRKDTVSDGARNSGPETDPNHGTSEALAPEPPAGGEGSDGKPRDRSPAESTEMLLAALDRVFSKGIDQRMIAAMPDFWRLYYQAAEAKIDFKPKDPAVYRQSSVDQKAKLISVLDPPSNEFAQANGIAGTALYHAVVGSDGKVREVVAGRPIGFGLDESAAETIRKAMFQPAVKDGKPVPVALDLVVSFRIYSKLTSQPRAQSTRAKPDEPVLPGPYSLQSHTQSPQQSRTLE